MNDFLCVQWVLCCYKFKRNRSLLVFTFVSQFHIRGSESVKASSLPKESWHWRHLPLGVMWDFEKASTFTARTHVVFLKISSIVFFINTCKVMYSRFQNCSKNKIMFGEKERLQNRKKTMEIRRKKDIYIYIYFYLSTLSIYWSERIIRN